MYVGFTGVLIYFVVIVLEILVVLVIDLVFLIVWVGFGIYLRSFDFLGFVGVRLRYVLVYYVLLILFTFCFYLLLWVVWFAVGFGWFTGGFLVISRFRGCLLADRG